MVRDREIWHVQSMGLQRVGDDSVTKQQQQSHNQRGKKREKLEGHKYEGLPCFFPLESPHFKNVPLVPRVLVSLSPVKRIQMTLFVWKLACQRRHLCQKAALQWRERWLCHVDLPFLMPSNQVNTSSSQLPKSAENTSLLIWKDYFHIRTIYRSHGIDL